MKITQKQIDSFSKREREVFDLFRKGYTTLEIAKKLKMHRNAAKGYYMFNIYKKLGMGTSDGGSLRHKARKLLIALCNCKIK